MALKGLIEENLKYDIEYTISRYDNGEKRNIHSLAEVEYDKKGNPVRVLGVIQDVTKRVENEIKLQKSYEELSSLYEEIAASEEELKEQVYILNETSNRLSESERRLYKAQAIGHVGNWEYDLVKKTMWASEESLKLYWANSEDGRIPIEYIYECFDPIDRKKIYNGLEFLVKNNSVNNTEYNIEHKIINIENGEVRYMQSSAEA